MNAQYVCDEMEVGEGGLSDVGSVRLIAWLYIFYVSMSAPASTTHVYSLFTLRKPRSPLRINGGRDFLRWTDYTALDNNLFYQISTPSLF